MPAASAISQANGGRTAGLEVSKSWRICSWCIWRIRIGGLPRRDGPVRARGSGRSQCVFSLQYILSPGAPRVCDMSASPQRGYSWRTIMKARFGMALSMVVGAALGGAAIQALHAQAKPPVYMIAINEVSDQERYAKEYVSPAQKSVKDHGGEYVAAGPGTQVAGNLPHGPVVILRWDSMEALQAWHNSPDFQAALKIGEKYAKFNIVAVNGLK